MSMVATTVRSGSQMAPVVPRVIGIGLGSFGQQVLCAFQANYWPSIPAYSVRLTAALHDEGGAGFQLFSFEPDECDPPAWMGLSEVATLTAAALQESLAEQLYLARRKIASQVVHSELLQQGYSIGQVTEVCLFIRAATPEQIDWLQRVATVTRAYLQQFDTVRLVVFVCLADIATPLADRNNCNAVIKALKRLLIARHSQHEQYRGELLLDRCYIISQDTANAQAYGNGYLPDNDQVQRTAGFFAARYLQGLRQPMTVYENLLFGSRQPDIDPTSATPMVDLFGYNELRFEISPIIDWCAARQAQLVITQELLRVTEPAAVADDHPDGLELIALHQHLRAAGLPATLDEQLAWLLDQVAESGTAQQEPGVLPACMCLDFWRESRRSYEAVLQAAAKQLDQVTQDLYQRYSQAFNELLNDEICDNVAGLSRADALLTSIDHWCRAGANRPASQIKLAGSRRTNNEAHTVEQLRMAWRQLSIMAAWQPVWFKVAPQIGLIVLIGMALGLTGPIGLVAACIVLAAGAYWVGYLRWSAPRRLNRAQRAFSESLSNWKTDQFRQAAESRLHAMHKQLGKQVAQQSSVPDEYNLRQVVADWRSQLRIAARVCEERASLLARASTAQNHTNGEYRHQLEKVVVSDRELQEYYGRLTTWQPSEVSTAFLAQMKQERINIEEFTADQISGRLIALCHQWYDQRTDVQLTGLERHLREFAASSPDGIAHLLNAMVVSAAPMARIQRCHSYWEQPALRLLVVHNPEQSLFRDPARRLNLTLVGGASKRQVICICTEHMVSLEDLALIHDWRHTLGQTESEPPDARVD